MTQRTQKHEEKRKAQKQRQSSRAVKGTAPACCKKPKRRTRALPHSKAPLPARSCPQPPGRWLPSGPLGAAQAAPGRARPAAASGSGRRRHYAQGPAPRGEPARPLPGPGAAPATAQRRGEALLRRGRGERRRGSAPRGLFTFVGLGDLRHFVQRQRRRGGTGPAPPLPLRGGGEGAAVRRRGSRPGRGPRGAGALRVRGGGGAEPPARRLGGA